MSRTRVFANMDTQRINLDSGVVIYDADAFAAVDVRPETSWFRPEHWESRGLVRARQPGRGTALMITSPIGPVVLRQYLRGGLVAKLVESSYLFTGYDRSRPLREFMVLKQLAGMNLPAPRPVAALCERHGLSSTGAIMTHEIEKVRPLDQVSAGLVEEDWYAIGNTVRRFHDHGLVHADLNVRNILVQDGGRVFLVDFDRAKFRTNAKGAFAANLKRLHRSMVKARQAQIEGMTEQAWTQLLKGYGS